MGGCFQNPEKLPYVLGTPFPQALVKTLDLASSAAEAKLCTGGLDVIQKEAWAFFRTSSGVRLCWELEEPNGPKGRPRPPRDSHPCLVSLAELQG